MHIVANSMQIAQSQDGASVRSNLSTYRDALVLLTMSLMSVSYTHLDVYKRQAELFVTVTGTVVFTPTVWLPNAMLVGLSAVSYTHL